MAYEFRQPNFNPIVPLPDVPSSLDQVFNMYQSLKRGQREESLLPLQQQSAQLDLANKRLDFMRGSGGLSPEQAMDPQAQKLIQEFISRQRGQSQLSSEADLKLKQAQAANYASEAAKNMATLRPGAAGLVTDPYKKSQIEGQIMDDFMKSQTVKDFDQVKNAVRNISALTSKPGGINDVGTLYSFVKLLDPNSVVREGEISLSQNAVPGLDRVALAWNKFKAGRINTDQMNKEIRNASKDIYQERKKGLGQIQAAYSARAKQYGIDPSIVAPDISLPQSEFQSMFPDQGGAPAVGTTEDGYRFKGGNPGDPSSWEKL